MSNAYNSKPLQAKNEPHTIASAHPGGNFHMQQIEGPPLSLRTRIKRLARNPLCVSKAIFRPDTVIGLFGNRYAFGTPL